MRLDGAVWLGGELAVGADYAEMKVVRGGDRQRGPTRTTRATARLVFIWRCIVVELAAKSEGGPTGAVAPAMLRGSLLMAVVVAVVVVVVMATSLGRGLVMVRTLVLLLSPAHTSLYGCENVCGCGVRGWWSSCGG